MIRDNVSKAEMTVEERIHWLSQWVEVHLLPFVPEKNIERELWAKRREWEKD